MNGRFTTIGQFSFEIGMGIRIYFSRDFFFSSNTTKIYNKRFFR